MKNSKFTPKPPDFVNFPACNENFIFRTCFKIFLSETLGKVFPSLNKMALEWTYEKKSSRNPT